VVPPLTPEERDLSGLAEDGAASPHA